MKYLLVAALGLLIGAAAAGAAIYYNPFTMTKSAHLDVADRALHYSLPSEVLGFALGDAIMPPGTPKRDGSLWEETIDRTAMLSLVLDDAHDNPTAIASRLLAVSPRTDFVLSGVRVNDYWLLTIPGEGTLFLRAETNVWPFLKETLPVWYLGRPWKGPSEYSPTAGPGELGAAVVLGATGRFVGLEGSAIEKYRLTDLDPAARSAAATGELDVRLSASQVAKSE
jgi:hypothetical protein